MCILICYTSLLFLKKKKTFATLVTLIWLFTRMNSLMYYKILSHTEPFVTGCIGMIFLKYVFSGVPSKTFFTLCIIWCSTRHIFQAKHLSHCLHTYSLPPLCVLWWCNRKIGCNSIFYPWSELGCGFQKWSYFLFNNYNHDKRNGFLYHNHFHPLSSYISRWGHLGVKIHHIYLILGGPLISQL